MKLPIPRETYNAAAERERNRQLEQALGQAFRPHRECEVGSGRIVLQSPDGTRWELTVDNSGTIGATSL